jgi:pyruvate/2-oxoglutarate dehydrogenase complex dihydrolipoamide dehydrogenase (E3) component
VGCEFTELFSSFGVEVTLVDHNSHLLSKEDPEIGLLMGELFRRRGVRVLTQATAQNIRRENGAKLVTIQHSDGAETIAVDEIMIATGKAPHLDVGLDAANIRYNEKGIEVDETLRTSNPNVYAGGDVVGPYKFTHAGSYQGWLAVNNAFLPRADRVKADYSAMPRCVFTWPEVATIGLTEREARDRGVAASMGFVEIAEASRADTANELDGFVKVIADSDGKIVGASIVAARAGEMLHEIAVAMTVGATTYQIASTVHAFPTFSEAVQMACAQAAE